MLRRRTTATPCVRQHSVQSITDHRSFSRHSCCTVFVKRFAGDVGDRKVPGNVRLAFEGGDNLPVQLRLSPPLTPAVNRLGPKRYAMPRCAAWRSQT